MSFVLKEKQVMCMPQVRPPGHPLAGGLPSAPDAKKLTFLAGQSRSSCSGEQPRVTAL